MSEPRVTPEQYEAAQHVLNRIGAGGYQGGSFTEKLLDLFERADPDNTARLKAAFPELGEAIYQVRHADNGKERLQARVDRFHQQD